MNQHYVLGRRLMIPAVIAAVVLLVDQLSKAWVLRTWPQPYTGDLPIIDNWLELTYIQNTGVAFGLFSGVPQLFTITSIVIVAVAIHFYLKHVPEDHGWLALSLGLIVGGALGNVVDRIRFGYVVDFIKTFDGRFPVFNVADSCIVVGVFVMAIFLAQSEDRSPPPRVAPTIEAEDGR
ncbi:MAG TPA: signal peptidase II [Herpetosiphonaceae bacterium]